MGVHEVLLSSSSCYLIVDSIVVSLVFFFHQAPYTNLQLEKFQCLNKYTKEF